MAQATTDADTSDSTDLAVLYENDATAQAIEDIRNGRALAYSSIDASDPAARLDILEAVTNSEPVRQHEKELFYIENIVIQKISMADQQTGEMVTQPRIVFLVRQGAPDGDPIALHAISQGLLRSVNNLLGILGEPANWGGVLPPAAFLRAGAAGREYLTMKFGNAALALTKKK